MDVFSVYVSEASESRTVVCFPDNRPGLDQVHEHLVCGVPCSVCEADCRMYLDEQCPAVPCAAREDIPEHGG